MTTSHSTRGLAALLSVGALTLTLAACGDDDDRTPGQLGQEPAAENEPAEEPETEQEDDAEEPEEPEADTEPEEPAQEDPLDDEEDVEDEDDDPLPGADSDLELDQEIVCDMLDTSHLDDLAGGDHSFTTDPETAFSGTYYCRWESEDYSGDMQEADYYGGLLLDASVTPGDDLVSAEEYFEMHRDSTTFSVTELDGIGVEAYMVEDLGSIYVLFEDDHYLYFQGVGDFWDDHALDLAEEFAENWENK
ncbi:hypothetical protein [Nesterenkonia alkaliphila]|uniref:DUF3558 domain-containing protein n=1 Tax=Nesterenkonia alkaliphila TaxID=1463631 RepID=A0A7K1UIL7_9MICC|nr:hypothetical protein [Nesterenkonia alkaliphila]MVT26323.1 hypothetical protein [Nesterenkonia alkaliphila]GFZ88363.1 hypothetical protein GCM10011359_17070 [Nesterenkonia alkaliphila]